MGFRPMPGAASCRTSRALQFRNSQQVVRRRRQVGGDLGSGLADEAGLSHSTHRLQPAEDLLDSLSFALADLVARGAGRAPVEPRCLASFDAGNVRPDVVLAKMLDEVLHVVALVDTQGLGVDLPAPGTGQQLAGRLVFGQGGVGDEQIHAQATTVLHERMAAVAQFGRLAVAFSHELRCGIGAALVGGVGALLALEIHHPGAVTTGLGRFAVLGLEALEGGPGVNQRAVNGEVIGGEQLVLAGQTHNLVEETPGDVGFHQAFAQAAEVRLIEPTRFQVQIEKPVEQQVVIECSQKSRSERTE